MSLDKFLEQRMQRIIFIVDASVRKIIQKEFKKAKSDIIKEVLKNGKNSKIKIK